MVLSLALLFVWSPRGVVTRTGDLTSRPGFGRMCAVANVDVAQWQS